MNDEVKPFSFRSIFKWLGAGFLVKERQQGLSGTSQTQPRGQAEKLSTMEGRKILVLDDDLIVQRTVTQALQKKGYQVFTVGDISGALSLIRQEKPDLILLDLTFPFNPDDVGGPARDGFFLVEWLRRATGEQIIPIIIISSTDPAEYKDQMSAGGIIACFQKPLPHDQLLSAVQNTLGGGRWD